MLLCIFKMLEYNKKGIYAVGFIDPYIINVKVLQDHPKDMTWSMTCSHFLPSKVLKGKYYIEGWHA
jgi:hypothetical protein